jgi:hypothetical protein
MPNRVNNQSSVETATLADNLVTLDNILEVSCDTRPADRIPVPAASSNISTRERGERGKRGLNACTQKSGIM